MTGIHGETEHDTVTAQHREKRGRNGTGDWGNGGYGKAGVVEYTTERYTVVESVVVFP